MPMRFAYYKDGKASLKIQAKDISSIKEYREKYRNHLFCSEDGCEAKIELAHRRSIPYFRTWQNSKHAPDCYFSFENSPQKSPHRGGENVLGLVSAQHKKAALQYSDRKRKEDEGQVAKRGRTSSTTDRRRPVDAVTRTVATVDANAEAIVTGIREPRIPTRKCGDVTDKDIDQAINVRGYIVSAIIEETSISLLFDTASDNKVRIFFYNRFRDNSRQAYDWIAQIAADINHGARIFASCIGICEKKADCYSIQIFESEDLHFNDKSLATFMLTR